MEHFDVAPNGVTEAEPSRNSIVVPAGVKNAGWRKVSAAVAATDRLASAGEHLAIPKSQAFVAVKRVGAQIGLKAADMMLLDTLGAFTQSQDWEAGRRPIVWASNAFLMAQTGFSLSALKRHARRLAEAGVLAFKDSPNGKRWGRRNADGVIIEAYGFDLSPMAARAEEFEALAAELAAERALCQRLRRQITVARRTIRGHIEAAIAGAYAGPWARMTRWFEALLARLPKQNTPSEALAQIHAWFQKLRIRVELAFVAGAEWDAEHTQVIESNSKELDPKEVISDPHIPTTNQLPPVTCNSSEKEEATGPSTHPEPAQADSAKLDDWVRETQKKHTAIDLPVVLQTCPEFTSWARNMGGYLRDWGDLHRVAAQLRPMIGISDHAWNVAQDRLGKQMATAALVLVFEKHSEGEVTSPGGYLRGMIEKAGAGELHLERSFYGRMRKLAA